MRSDGRKRVTESKAIDKKDIVASLAKLLFKITITEEHLAHQCLRGRRVDIASIPKGSSNIPPPLGNTCLHLLIQIRIVFLGQAIADRSLKIHAVMRKFLDQIKVLLQSLADTGTDRILYRPIPLGIEVSIRHQIHFFLL